MAASASPVDESGGFEISDQFPDFPRHEVAMLSSPERLSARDDGVKERFHLLSTRISQVDLSTFPAACVTGVRTQSPRRPRTWDRPRSARVQLNMLVAFTVHRRGAVRGLAVPESGARRRSRDPALPRRSRHLGDPGDGVRALQLAQGQPHPAGSQHAPASHADQAALNPSIVQRLKSPCTACGGCSVDESSIHLGVGAYGPVSDPVAMSRAANNDVVRAGGSRGCVAPQALDASAAPAGCAPTLESAASRPRTTPPRARADAGTDPRCRVPSR